MDDVTAGIIGFLARLCLAPIEYGIYGWFFIVPFGLIGIVLLLSGHYIVGSIITGLAILFGWLNVRAQRKEKLMRQNVERDAKDD